MKEKQTFHESTHIKVWKSEKYHGESCESKNAILLATNRYQRRLHSFETISQQFKEEIMEGNQRKKEEMKIEEEDYVTTYTSNEE